MTLLDGRLSLPAPGVVEVVAQAAVWTFAVALVMIILSGRSQNPVREALRLLPTGILALLGIAAVVLAAFLAVGLVLPAGPVGFGIAALLTLLPVSYLVVRLALVVAVAACPGEPSLTSGIWRVAARRACSCYCCSALWFRRSCRAGCQTAIGTPSSGLPLNTMALVAVVGVQALY